ncbi:hypothetical protein [Salana multivorans]
MPPTPPAPAGGRRGAQKAPALAAALRGGYLGALVIDVSAAQALAHLPERRSQQAADWRLRASVIDSRATAPASGERAGEAGEAVAVAPQRM